MSAYAIAFYVLVILSGLFLCIATIQRALPKSIYVAFFALSNFVFILSSLFIFHSNSLETAFVSSNIQQIALAFAGPIFYLFVQDYYGRSISSRRSLALLFAYPVGITLILCTPASLWLYNAVSPTLSRFTSIPEPMHWVNIAFFCGFFIAGIVAVIRFLGRGKSESPRHPVLILTAATITIFIFTEQLLGLLPVAQNTKSVVASLALTITCAVLLWHINRAPSAYWMPLARDHVLEGINDGFILIDNCGLFLDANAVAMQYFPELRGMRMGTPIRQIETFPVALLEENSPSQEFTLQNGDETLYLRTSHSPIQFKNKAVCTCIMIYDHTEIHHLLAELNVLASHDALTGLLNRGTFFQMAGHNFDLARRTDDSVAVMMLDIDFFKQVNDRFGHMCGDVVLTEIANLLRVRLRHTDLIARYGGEEMSVFLPGASRDGSMMIAEILRRTVEQKTFICGEDTLNITISIGVAVIDKKHHHTLELFVADADKALYEAKATGRNKVCLYQNITQDA